MLPLLKKIHEIGEEDDDVFEGALLGIESGIEGYPEWMGADQDRCILGFPSSFEAAGYIEDCRRLLHEDSQ